MLAPLTDPTELRVVLPDESPAMEPGRLAGLAVQAERLGYGAVLLPDHLLPPEPYGAAFGGVYEPLTTLAYLAAATQRLRLGTSVLVLSLRDPFLVAKQAATVHRLSGGRLLLAVGAGWVRTEFDAVGADYAGRGRYVEDAVRVMRALFDGATSYDGPRFGFERGVFEPRPLTPLPIAVGGTTDAALNRVAAVADEWHAFALDADGFASRLARLRALRDDGPLAGRPLRAGTRIEWAGGRDELAAAVESVQKLAAAGADSVAVWFGDHEGFGDRMDEFAAAFS
ncbi:TIGR03619 family F420-dependent LLM class oxidoreductase [Jiangella alkaliphila]|uniref:Probable F420-dependent oxidoreductase, Rv2161c family n=1 Tax=Jiangella alkaliphila TaxID=419479 RepID=A0A1H2KC99_9ACTN|nr:TIGR03619 family F420-dependent LLM class oxidoreductase [Jiangella alkaliphila]SDU66357.1 probable F420-dependent oxidoreductase, Rv2161c family [Jiangella alkaliphila]